MTKTITTTISDEFYKLAKEKKIGWSHAVAKGIRMIVEGDRTQAEIQQLKEGNLRLHGKLTELSTEVRNLRNK